VRLLDDLPDAVVLVDADGTVADANPLARGLLQGFDPAWSGPMDEALAAATSVARVEVRRRNGVPVLLDLRFGAPREGGRLCVLREVNHVDLATEAQRHFDAAFEASPVGMALFNADGEYVRVNDSLCVLVGRTRDELLGSHDRDITHPDDREMVSDRAWSILRGEIRSSTHEQRFVRPDGTIVWVIAHAAFLRDDAGRPLSWVCQFVDITARRAAEAELERLARHDVMTGLLNRRAFEERLAEEVARAQRSGNPLSLVVLDIDDFKAINDVHGHPGGDRVLAEVGRRLSGVVRTGEPIARIGGEEFAWILPATDAATAWAAAERARRAIGDVGFPGIGRVSIAAGVSDLDEAAGCPVELYRLADLALYAAKDDGGDAVHPTATW
jgi:diguanylate cyclase (GGDEF)-like protein/PAS domain S-box-containing protein